MPTYQHRNGKIAVTVRVKGHPSASETFFDTKEGRAAAKEWAERTHAQIKLGQFTSKKTKREQEAARDREKVEKDTYDPPFEVAAAVWEVQHAMKLSGYERGMAGRIRIVSQDTHLIGKRLSEIRARHITLMYRAWQNEGFKSSTIRNRLSVVRGVFKHYLPLNDALESPFERVSAPKPDEGRDRRLFDGEENRLLEATERCRWPHLRAMIILAIETAWRQGELRLIRWKEVKLNEGLHGELYLPPSKSKNGKARNTPLSPRARAAIESLPRGIGNASIWGPRAPKMYEIVNRYRRATERAKLDDLTFHDLRHEACSRLHELGFSSIEVMAFFSGHKTLAMLKRYTNLYRTRSIHERLARENNAGIQQQLATS